ncbi:hypothetical protein M5689_025163 [Euphorbia peplus]|nr:hypothetical protein M5689_025163 [Euphorbia peplus]
MLYLYLSLSHVGLRFFEILQSLRKARSRAVSWLFQLCSRKENQLSSRVLINIQTPLVPSPINAKMIGGSTLRFSSAKETLTHAEAMRALSTMAQIIGFKG